jgi:hypothetical protein
MHLSNQVLHAPVHFSQSCSRPSLIISPCFIRKCCLQSVQAVAQIYVGSAIYIRCIIGILGREITNIRSYTAHIYIYIYIYIYVQFWPILDMRLEAVSGDVLK